MYALGYACYGGREILKNPGDRTLHFEQRTRLHEGDNTGPQNVHSIANGNTGLKESLQSAPNTLRNIGRDGQGKQRGTVLPSPVFAEVNDPLNAVKGSRRGSHTGADNPCSYAHDSSIDMNFLSNNRSHRRGVSLVNSAHVCPGAGPRIRERDVDVEPREQRISCITSGLLLVTPVGWKAVDKRPCKVVSAQRTRTGDQVLEVLPSVSCGRGIC